MLGPFARTIVLTCAMRVTVEPAAERCRRPRHPPTQGVLCTIISRLPIVFIILTVHRSAQAHRCEGEGRFAPITWNEAFGEIGAPANRRALAGVDLRSTISTS
jgi:anaerobic selenocysteine-containing dehydrogenase